MISSLANSQSVLKACSSGLLLLIIAGCGAGLEDFTGTDENGNRTITATIAAAPSSAAATPSIRSSSRTVNLAPDDEYTVRVRALSADQSAGEWSTAVLVTPPLESPAKEGLLDDGLTVETMNIKWTAQDDAVAWEVVFERTFDKVRVAHRTIKTDDLCNSEGFCSLTPGFNTSENSSTVLPIATAYPTYGEAPLAVEFDVDDYIKTEVSSIDWMLSGSTENFSSKKTWTANFKEPGEYEFSLLSLDRYGNESVSTVLITVTEPSGASSENESDPIAPKGTGKPLVSIPEAPITSNTPAPTVIVTVNVNVYPNQITTEVEQGDTTTNSSPSEGVDEAVSSAVSQAVNEAVGKTNPSPFAVTPPPATIDPSKSDNVVADNTNTDTPKDNQGTDQPTKTENTPEENTPEEESKTENTNSGTEAGSSEQNGPVISNITVTQLSDQEATVVWDLDRFSTGVIEYGINKELGQWSNKETSFNWSSHRQTLGGLQANTTYYFRIHAEDEAGGSSISGIQEFTTYEADLSLASAKSSSINSGDSSAYNNNLPYGGLFYGNPTGGVHTANSQIAVNSSRRFRAERTGLVQSVRYHNRFLLQSDIDYRCELYGRVSGSKGKYCACKDAGLDPVSCSYTLGSSYMVGNGGLITIEVKPDDGNGFPSNTVLAKSKPFIPYDLRTKDAYPLINFITPAKLTAGNVYHLVYSNSKPPIKCAMAGVPLSQAASCDRDRGAIGLNGVFYPHTSTTSGKLGPWYGTKSAANIYQYKNGGPWYLYEKNLSWYELTYTDGVNVGDTYHSLNVFKSPMKRDIEGSIRARQRFTVMDASRRVDGVWLNFGHTTSANGSPLSVVLKDEKGNALANGSIAASAACRKTAKGDGFDRHCRDWGYTAFGRTVELLEGNSYSVEFSAAKGAGFAMSTIEALSASHPFNDRNNWVQARGEISTDGGKSWGKWDTRYADERDMSVLFTIEGMPRQMP